jgi:hypothetical protein
MFFGTQQQQRRSEDPLLLPSSLPATGCQYPRRLNFPLKFLQAAGICLVLLTYLSLFVYMEGDGMSYENVLAVNKAEEARIELLREEVKVRRAKEREEMEKRKKGMNSERNSDDGDVSLLHLLLLYVILRFWLGSRSTNDGNDGATEGNNNANHNHHHNNNNATNTGATPEEINRLPLRVVQATDEPFLTSSSSSSSSSTRSGATARQPDAAVASNNSNNNNNSHNSHRCSVCLEAYRAGDQLRTVPCFHSFHKHCIDDWLSRKAECPVCKHSVL